MKIQTKFISLLLAVLLMLGSLSVLSVISVSAAEEDKETGTTDKKEEEEEEETIDYTTLVYTDPKAKRDTMELALTKGNYQLYVDRFSGEVAYYNTVTDETLFTNPYDIGTSTLGSEKTKQELLSQIVIQYTDNNTSPIFVSYEMAALKDQITVKKIKNGIRVQYTLGREQARKLVPGMLSVARFEEVICAKALENGISEFDYSKLTAYYLKLSLEGLSERGRAELIDAFPIVEKMDVYVFDQNASETEKNKIEGYIKTYCPEYTYEELDADHAETEYESQDKNPPLFKLALEYTLDEHGLTVRLPANGIRFNESLYQLESLQVLPYMGAGNSAYDGYTFYPDGAGSLYEFDDLEDTKTRTVRGKVYGTDFAYHSITGTYQQAIRYPVFGVVENSVYYDFIETVEDAETGEVKEEKTTLSGTIVDQINKFNSSVSGPTDSIPTLVQEYGALVGSSAIKQVKKEIDRGYVAIMEEGDALTDIMTYHAGSLSDYNTIKMIFNPRPSDSYNLQDSISVGSDATWTVVSERKYVGNYKIRYVMLSDSDLAEENKVTDYYETSWLGMALAYRDYLDRSGLLTRLTAENLEKDIPLYIETFGALETTERILSIPVDVMTPLTTFENVKTMYDELAAEGITNINFKLTGYANGGMYSIVPSKLKWEKAVGGKDGFQSLVDYAAEVNKTEGSNLGIFPDFDFSYINETAMFDGVNLRWHAVRTIDDRYASYREYSATEQKHVSHYQMAISPASFNKFYEKLAKNYLKYDNVNGISVGTLGNTLNSDFDEDDPYNREDSKEFVATALEFFSGLENNQGQEIEVMSEGGNAFTWKFLDHLLDVSLDSSRNNDAAHAVPFVGVVLHGYINFTGAPMNMEGNIQYAMLKAIENGASPYYILSYQNTQNLKDYYLLSHYYSVRYDIWKDDVIEMYNELNGVLGDVQDKLIIDHEFWDGTRVPDSDELYNDIQDVLKSFIYDEENAGDVIALEKKQAVSIARKQAREAAEAAIASLDDAAAAFKQANDMYEPFKADCADLAEYKAGYDAFLATGIDYEAYAEFADAEEGTEEHDKYQQYLDFRSARSRYTTTRNRRLNDIVNIYNYYSKAYTALEAAQKHLEKAAKACETIGNELEISLDNPGMLPALLEEAEGYRDHTDMYINGLGEEHAEFTILKDKYLKDTTEYSAEEDVAAINAYVNAALDEHFAQIEAKYRLAEMEKISLTDEDVVAEVERLLTEYQGEEGTIKRTALFNYLLAEKVNAITGKENAEDDEKWATVLAEATELVAYINAYIDTCCEEIEAGVAENTLEDKKKATLTEAQLAEVEALSHFKYDYSKLYKTDVNTLIMYLRGEKIEAAYGEENTVEFEGLDFMHRPFTQYSDGAFGVFEGVKELVKEYISEQDIANRITPVGGGSDTEEEEEEEEFDKYAVEEGSIVVVTYGGKNGVDSDPYKSIILNYNNFSVSIEYQGKIYTLPAYGYVVVMQ